METSDLLILMGSARPDGNTAEAVRTLIRTYSGESELIELASLRIGPFSYRQTAGEDDFDTVVDRMLCHRHILMATPVYWYAMSGIMKSFFDRLTDLLTSSDPGRRGRRLAGRNVRLLAVGTDPDLPEGFEVPFALTARYFDMRWSGSCYCRCSEGGLEAGAEADIANFATTISG